MNSHSLVVHAFPNEMWHITNFLIDQPQNTTMSCEYNNNFTL